MLVDQYAIPTAINLIVNGLIAWLMNRSVSTMPVWGGASVALDLLATSFLLPFIVCAIISSTVKDFGQQRLLL